MGLALIIEDTNYCLYRYTYTAFNTLRAIIEDISGLDIDYQNYSEDNYQGIWDNQPNNGLLIFLVHSDCDGFIYQKDIDLLYDSLNKIIDDERLSMHATYSKTYKDVLKDILYGLKKAKSMNKRIGFH